MPFTVDEIIDVKEKKRKIEADFQEKKNAIKRMVDEKNYTDAIHFISKLAWELYEYNQYYTDADLEQWLMQAEKNIELPERKKGRKCGEKKRVLFYDGFGLDTRGLAQIYIRALAKMNVDIQYITVQSGNGNQPVLIKELEACGAKVIYLPDEYKIDLYKDICHYIEDFQPDSSFLYTTPWDTPGILAFMHFAGKMYRYQINLTDHAFWLGVNAFDYCLEFRDFGASLSVKYRGIPKEKLLMQPYYPIINKDVPFEGFPFEKEKGDFVIFSGGSLYKTFDKENTFYKIVDECLGRYSQVKFWYAGQGDATQLYNLIERYPKRVFFTPERRDLYQVLCHVDLYLNTIPLGGGLMTQYAAKAGKIPLTLDLHHFSEGFLLNQKDFGIEYTNLKDFQVELYRCIEDEQYRKHKEHCIVNAVITEEQFLSDLKKLVNYKKTNYKVNINEIELKSLHKVYFDRYIKEKGI